MPALVYDIRKSVVEILNISNAERKGHQLFKSYNKLLALWAADCAEHVLLYFEQKYPNDNRPRRAIEESRIWVTTGKFRMATIRGASLASHAAAREAKEDYAACYAARSAAQAVATAHVTTHALGAAVYAIKASAAHSGNPDDGLVSERNWQLQRLLEYKRRKISN